MYCHDVICCGLSSWWMKKVRYSERKAFQKLVLELSILSHPAKSRYSLIRAMGRTVKNLKKTFNNNGIGLIFRFLFKCQASEEWRASLQIYFMKDVLVLNWSECLRIAEAMKRWRSVCAPIQSRLRNQHYLWIITNTFLNSALATNGARVIKSQEDMWNGGEITSMLRFTTLENTSNDVDEEKEDSEFHFMTEFCIVEKNKKVWWKFKKRLSY